MKFAHDGNALIVRGFLQDSCGTLCQVCGNQMRLSVTLS